METLRNPGGCPWDAEQTHESLRTNLLEETYEALEAIDAGDPELLEEELGDLLIQIAFHADIASRNEQFDVHSISDKVRQKLQRRHPHVFGLDDPLATADEVVDRWEALKRAESGGTRSIVASVPDSLPALTQAAVLQRRVQRAGIVMSGGPGKAVTLTQPEPTLPPEELEEYFGEYLLRVVRQIQEAEIDPEIALLKACRSLKSRVMRTEALAGDTPLAELAEETRKELWERADQRATST